jgi:hypothetical protein
MWLHSVNGRIVASTCVYESLSSVHVILVAGPELAYLYN